MISSSRSAMRDENLVAQQQQQHVNKKAITDGSSMVMVVKTPAAATSKRRALGDISNRKATISTALHTSKASSTLPLTVVKQQQQQLPKKTLILESKKAEEDEPAAAITVASTKSRFPAGIYDDDDDIEQPAGRTWAQQQEREQSSFLSECLSESEDGDDSRIRWDTFFQDMERLHLEQQEEQEARMLKEHDQRVQQVMKQNDILDGKQGMMNNHSQDFDDFLDCSVDDDGDDSIIHYTPSSVDISF